MMLPPSACDKRSIFILNFLRIWIREKKSTRKKKLWIWRCDMKITKIANCDLLIRTLFLVNIVWLPATVSSSLRLAICTYSFAKLLVSSISSHAGSNSTTSLEKSNHWIAPRSSATFRQFWCLPLALPAWLWTVPSLHCSSSFSL